MPLVELIELKLLLMLKYNFLWIKNQNHFLINYLKVICSYNKRPNCLTCMLSNQTCRHLNNLQQMILSKKRFYKQNALYHIEDKEASTGTRPEIKLFSGDKCINLTICLEKKSHV